MSPAGPGGTRWYAVATRVAIRSADGVIRSSRIDDIPCIKSAGSSSGRRREPRNDGSQAHPASQRLNLDAANIINFGRAV
jgi:hypothetical protein